MSEIDPPGALTSRSSTSTRGVTSSAAIRRPSAYSTPFLLSDGAFTSLDVPGALSNGGMGPRASINPKGEIVSSYTGTDGKIRGVLIDAEGMRTVEFPNTQFTIATGLNARGDIVGWYRDLAGRDHGFLIRR